ncbi:MAG: phage major capsid protein [Casimicrobiaceae bacterium]
MADFQVTSATFDALLQEDYIRQDITDAINKATVFKSKLNRKGTIDGRRAIYPVMTGVAQGNGSRAEMAPLPAFGAGVYEDAIVNTMSHYARFIVSGQAEVFSSRKAFVDFAMRALKDTKEGLMLNIARQMWSAGDGALALVNGAVLAGVSTVTVDSAYGVLWGSLAGNTTFLFKKNMQIQFGAENNSGAGYSVTGSTGTTITFTPALAANVADNVVISINGSASSEMEGWLKIVATASLQNTLLGTVVYHNINRTNSPDWEGNATNASAALSLTNIRAIKDALFKRGGNPELCIVSTEVCRDYEALLTPNQRFVPAIKLEGGATAIEHDGVPFTKDKDAPAKALNLVSASAIEIVQRDDPNWQKQGDAIMRVVSGFDAKEGTLRWYANLDCSEPRKQAILYNLTVS